MGSVARGACPPLPGAGNPPYSSATPEKIANRRPGFHNLICRRRPESRGVGEGKTNTNLLVTTVVREKKLRNLYG